MDVSGLLYWSKTGLEDLRASLRSEEYPIRVELPRRKKSKFIRPFYTFIGRDAVEALRYYLSNRDIESDFIFPSNPGI
jgi:hypothetical protein